MERDTHYFLVGLFVLVTAVAGVIFAGLFYKKPYVATAAYDIHFATPVAGLAQGSEVRYMGIKVGEVASVALLPQTPVQVAVQVNLQSNTPINTGTVAILREQGLTGVPFISLEQDENSQNIAPLMAKDNGELPLIPTKPTDMDALMNKLPDLEQRLTGVLASVDQVLDAKNRQQFAELLQHLNTASAELPALMQNLTKTSAELPALAQNLNKTTQALPAVVNNVGKTSQQVGTLAVQMQSAVQQIDKLAADIDRVVVNNEANVNNLLGEGGANLTQLLAETRKTAVAIRQLSERLKQNPSQLIYQPAHQGTELPP